VKDPLTSSCAEDTLIGVLATGSPATPRDIARYIVQPEGSGSTSLIAAVAAVRSKGPETVLSLRPSKHGRRLIHRRRVPKLWLTVMLQNSGTGGSRAVLTRKLDSGVRGR
jgi:hypothetical protein